ncbi:OLC1v1027399C1 [Oldenlandia corymbosa var. corymbosa]|uniref:OLC1v1027399C1 n=1 Tax=Oldenlandia corymbosa var. corymbosa TaxID=529605 RepID=A0AAV1CA54_OLDCO|nr:OLC1v1027399C1 [Oldenlandia corymbosa var. corymbosa]
MFKSASWRSEKKIKAVFKMQFQASQVPKLKAKNLMISLVPADVGKPTARLGKSPIIEGTCSWENPVYETMKLVKETKTGKFKGKFYYFVVSTGSSKSGLVGEALIDFVDFIEAVNPVMISMPLEATETGALLHVTIQNLEGNLDERSVEEDESPKTDYYSGSLDSQLGENDRTENKNLEDTQDQQPNGITHLYEQKISFSSDDQSQDNMYRASPDILGDMYQISPDWSFKDTSHKSVTERANSPRKKCAPEKMQLHPDEVDRMNTQIKTLERQAEMADLELQSLRRHTAKETTKVQELTGRIVSLTHEKDALKAECEQLKTSLKSMQESEVSNNSLPTENLSNTSEEINQELSRQKQLNKRLKFQLQKTEDSNSELILTVRGLKEELNRKNTEVHHLSAKLKANKSEPKAQPDAHMYRTGRKKETKELEENVEEQNDTDELEYLKQELRSLTNELELSRKENEELKLQIQHLNQGYEIVKKDKDEVYSTLQQKQVEIMEMQNEYSESLNTVRKLKLQEESFMREIEKQALLHSEALSTIDELETEVKSLEERLEREANDFQDKLTEVSEAKAQQEQRVMRAEEALRNANWSKTKMTERLREEFRKETEEMTSKINESEKLAAQAVAEADELRQQNESLQNLLQKTNVELQAYKEKLERKNKDLSNGNSFREQEKKLCSLRKESETLKEENKQLKTLIDEMEKREEIMHLEMQKLSDQHDKLRRKKDIVINTAEETHCENDNQGTIKQKTGPANNQITFDGEPEKKGEGAYAHHCGELDTLDGTAAEIKLCKAQSKRTYSHSKNEVKKESHHAPHVSDMAKLLDETASLKEEKKHMAIELKEMQERYSEISLKFAEVEGERQQLVMMLRNLRNGKKA